MPPKRKAQAATAAAKAKKIKVEAPEPETMKDKIAKLKAADAGKVKKFKPDQQFPGASASEVRDQYSLKYCRLFIWTTLSSSGRTTQNRKEFSQGTGNYIKIDQFTYL